MGNHIFEMRTSKAAHTDMKKLMKGLKNEMQTLHSVLVRKMQND